MQPQGTSMPPPLSSKAKVHRAWVEPRPVEFSFVRRSSHIAKGNPSARIWLAPSSLGHLSPMTKIVC
jgi:hypothetical protein